MNYAVNKILQLRVKKARKMKQQRQSSIKSINRVIFNKVINIIIIF